MDKIFNEILKLWIEEKKEIKKQSILNYESLINSHIKDSIGNILINKLTNEDITSLFKNLEERNVAISTQKKIIYIIKSSINFAYNNGYLKHFLNIKNIKFKKNNSPIYIFSKEEQIKLEKYLKSKVNIRKISLLMCLYTGLRVGEMCGLKWEDINFKTNSLTVKRTIERIKNDSDNSKTILIESTPKSDTSNRVVPIPKFIIDLLKQFKSNDDYFLLSNSIVLYDTRLLQAFYYRTLKKCNINKCKFHTLRHTFATRATEAKMDVKTLSELLGHSKIETTLRLYVHPTYEYKQSLIENLALFMSN